MKKLLLLALWLPLAALAQGYPNKPVRLLVGFSATLLSIVIAFAALLASEWLNRRAREREGL